MSVAKGSVGHSSFIGAFAVATDLFSIIGNSATQAEEKIINDTLEAKAVRATIDGSALIGIYIAANSKGILVPEIADRREVENLKKQLDGIRVHVMRTDLTALRNNILANDKIAFVNPEFGSKEIATIKDILDVEVIKRQIGEFGTVGANNIITNRGIVLNNSASEQDIEMAKKHMENVSQSTANLGSSSIGLCLVANSKGMVIGTETTGFELVRLTEGLDL
ncbi:MAG: translation initiation factor IF-6 [Candidatus Micrarchaeota archaeon]|nr:translation initiation factor IF-6 [Candidatus Micrarchaeota archaeon]MDE1834320.1 translation initiation factor IF-6 [Candidatus Micrarchaeota archaeon]MDE1859097.1 translation initiation factor IF-6 [Candidatus Micrarchaeota archaeon]